MCITGPHEGIIKDLERNGRVVRKGTGRVRARICGTVTGRGCESRGTCRVGTRSETLRETGRVTLRGTERVTISSVCK